jgi:subtilisin family serine protease
MELDGDLLEVFTSYLDELEDQDQEDSESLFSSVLKGASSSDVVAYSYADQAVNIVYTEQEQSTGTVSVDIGDPYVKGVPVDTGMSSQWYINQAQNWDINVEAVWSDYTGSGVTVAVIDDGFDYTHSDLAPNYNLSADYADRCR